MQSNTNNSRLYIVIGMVFCAIALVILQFANSATDSAKQNSVPATQSLLSWKTIVENDKTTKIWTGRWEFNIYWKWEKNKNEYQKDLDLITWIRSYGLLMHASKVFYPLDLSKVPGYWCADDLVEIFCQNINDHGWVKEKIQECNNSIISTKYKYESNECSHGLSYRIVSNRLGDQFVVFAGILEDHKYVNFDGAVFIDAKYEDFEYAKSHKIIKQNNKRYWYYVNVFDY